MKTAIVTGGAGFLGRHLCRALVAAGWQIKIIDLKENPEFPTIIADVRDGAAMDQHISDASVVFHLAAYLEVGESVAQPHRYVENNIVGSLNVLESMRKNNIKQFVFSSTAAVYGEPTQIPLTETMPTTPINPYGATKLAMEGLLSAYVYNHGITGVALRYFNLYGPEEHHEPESHAIPRFIQQIAAGNEVTVWGSGEHLRDYIFISDIVDAHIKAIDFMNNNPASYHCFNLSTEQPTSVLAVIKTIASVLGVEPNIKHFPPRAGDPLKLYADASQARQQLSWQPKVSFEDGIRQTIAYFQSLQKN